MNNTSDINKLTKEQKQILKDLLGNDEAKVLASVKQLEHNGNSVFIKPLFDVYFQTESSKIKNKIIELISNLKDNTASSEIERIILDYRMHPDLKNLITAFWESSIHFTDMRPFCDLFSTADDVMAIELFSVIEQNNIYKNYEFNDRCIELIFSKDNNYSEFKLKLANELKNFFI